MKNGNWLWMISIPLGLLQACGAKNETPAEAQLTAVDSLQAKAPADSLHRDTAGVARLRLPGDVNTKNIPPQQVVDYAKTLLGVRYKYGASSPKTGFDCSGFVTHVFAHFGIVVPRSSVAFTHVGKDISVAEAKPGDIILFTGTNPKERFVGHMGIVVNNQDTLQFIHSSSGRANGVTITPLNEGYQKRYVKTIRIFPENG